MEATLCVRPITASGKTLHCLLGTNRKIPDQHQYCLALHGKGFTKPTLFRGTLRSGPNRMYQLLMRTNVPPPPPPKEFGSGMAVSQNRQRGARAAMIMACFVGALCLNLRGSRLALAAPFGWSPMGRPSSPQAVSSDSSSPDRSRDGSRDFGGLAIVESINILSAIFQAKFRPPGHLTELELVKMHMTSGRELAERFPSITEDTAVHVVRREWKNEYGLPKYYLGLLLVDIFINQGNLMKAKAICDKIDELNIAPKFDSAYKLRKRIIDEIQSDYERLLDLIKSEKENTEPPSVGPPDIN